MSSPAHIVAIRGPLVYPTGDPFLMEPERAVAHEPDGLIVARDGIIAAVGDYAALAASLPPGTDVAHYPDALIVPGFVDAHVHYVQLGMAGSWGAQLTDWLQRYAFPAERAFADPVYAAAQARLFCDELLRNGTTTALVFASVHPQSADALFAEAEGRGLALIAGKVLMDRNAPADLCDTAQRGYDDSKALIARWHGRGRLRYAITPRFAPTSTPEQLDLAAALWREHPGVHLHTHLAENLAEIDWVRRLFPERADYLDVYAHHGLTGRRALFAHGVHLSDANCATCHATASALAHCPTSNAFLGSGLFRMAQAKDAARPVEVGLGTDVGAGTSLSLLRTAGAAYDTGQLSGMALDPAQLLYLATLGGAKALDLDSETGTFAVGRYADIVVLDPAATPFLAQRTARSGSALETLFALMALGDDRAVRATYAAGRLAHERGRAS